MRWIIFDFDEVISATGDGFTTFLERINERIPVDVAKGAAWMREQWKHFATHAWDEHELLSRMNRFLGVEIPFALFDEAFHHTIFPSEEVIRVIALLKKRGYKVALLTDNARIRLEKIAAHPARSEEHTSELQSQFHLLCRLLLEKKWKLAQGGGMEMTSRRSYRTR